MGQSGMVGYSDTDVVEWNKWGRVGRLDITITHHRYNQFIRLDIVDDGGLILFSFVFFGCVFILDGVLWISGVEWDGWGRVWWVE